MADIEKECDGEEEEDDEGVPGGAVGLLRVEEEEAPGSAFPKDAPDADAEVDVNVEVEDTEDIGRDDDVPKLMLPLAPLAPRGDGSTESDAPLAGAWGRASVREAREADDGVGAAEAPGRAWGDLDANAWLVLVLEVLELELEPGPWEDTADDEDRAVLRADGFKVFAWRDCNLGPGELERDSDRALDWPMAEEGASLLPC